MPTVPTYGDAPRVRSTAEPAVYSTPEQFGANAARQQQDLGRAISSASQAGSDILVKMQEQKNLETVFQAETVMKRAAASFHTEASKRTGVNAEGLVEEAMKFWDKQRQDLGNMLQNDAQRKAFRQTYEDARTASLGKISQHVTTQQRQAANTSAEADRDAIIQDGIADPGNADYNAARLASVLRAQGQMNGTPKQETDNAIEKARTKMHAGVIASLVDKSPWAARKYYNEYKDAVDSNGVRHISPSAREKIESALRTGETLGYAQRKADEIMAKYPDDPAAQDKAAREATSDPKRRQALQAQINALQADDYQNEQRKYAKARDDVMTYINDVTQRGKYVAAPSDVPTTMWEAMDGAGKTYVTNSLATAAQNRGGPPKYTNREVQDMMEKQIEDGSIKQPEQLRQFEFYLTQEDYNRAKTKLAAAGKVDQTKLRRVFEQRMGGTVSDWAKGKGWNASLNIKLWEAFQDYANRGVEDRSYKHDEYYKMMDDFNINNPRSFKPDTTFGEELARDPQLLDRSVGVYTVTSGGKPPVSVAGIDRAVRQLSAIGYEFTPENIGLALHLLKDGYSIDEPNMGRMLKAYGDLVK